MQRSSLTWCGYEAVPPEIVYFDMSTDDYRRANIIKEADSNDKNVMADIVLS